MIAARRKRRPPRDPAPLISLARGDVVQCGERAGVVAGCSVSRALLWPVCWRSAERAADIPVTGWADSAMLGNPKQAMVQANVLLDVPLIGQRRLGRVTDHLLGLIERAAARDAAAMATIKRWTGEREHRRDECDPPSKAL